MNIRKFFESSAASLPKSRGEDGFQTYLNKIMNKYLCAVTQLDNDCVLCQRIQNNELLIRDVAGWVRGAVRRYLEGQPEIAYRALRLGIYKLDRLGHLVSKDITPSDLGRLYRMTHLRPSELSRSRLFHIPFEKRYHVGRHRYGIPGFPCIYLGGSLRVCQLEIDHPDHKLHRVGIAEFIPRHTVKLLDFGYPPSIIGHLAKGRSLTSNPPNPQLENFIVNYAICWPIIAACSIRRRHNGEFAEEYIVPQLLLQWLMRETMCDGIRYFSTRMEATDNNPKPTANYVFPALPPPDTGHSQKLKNLFKFSDPCMWQGMTPWQRMLVRFMPYHRQNILPKQFERNRNHLASLEKTPL